MSDTRRPHSTSEGERQELIASDQLIDFFVGAEEQRSIASSYDSQSFVGAPRLGGETAELLAFWLGDEEYAIDILEIQELIKLPLVTPVPRARDGVLGIISLRGTIVPVLDLSVMLALDKRPVSRSSRVVVLRAGGDPVGLVVDRVTSVVRFDREKIEPVPRAMQSDVGDMLAGVGRVNERMLIVLDLPSILTSLETGQ
ncbi:MAG: purine-binding chemotaxis protein CheW [Clostridia bacterium]|nr:purine-binding chemotaxis protein CheW [Deltaproteobacteria bacterium]